MTFFTEEDLEVVAISRKNLTYSKNKALFGIIEFNRLVKTTSLGNNIVIKTQLQIDDVYVNGVKYIRKG